ncbi:hypothetical protein CMI47_11915 [Candidatus Pacearchaeota archaeon]|nr:hypothetical protein [Candidatus Pacearchaeota archaeon]
MDAISKTEGPCVVLAGAGTGKTYTIVEKIKELVDSGKYDAEKIVCITFSNEACNNLVLRIGKLLGQDVAEKIVIRTFHGFSADLLREYGDRVGISKEFKILDPNEAKVVLHRNLRIPAGLCHSYIGTIGTAKDLGIAVEEFESYLTRKMEKYGDADLSKKLENLQFGLQTLHLKDDKQGKRDLVNEIKTIRNLIALKKFVSAWKAYEKLKAKANYQDYSDLNNNSLKLLESHREIASDFDYVIVDEFQDTNKLQLDFLIKLCPHRNITVVGDLNQSIYRFRGAYRKNISLFREAFDVSDKDVFNLDKSFRSPNKILKVAHKLILNNYKNKDECFFVESAFNREGDKVEVFELKDSREEARKVVELIKSGVSGGTPEEEICVLFRNHQYGRVIRKALEEAGIKYCAVSKASLLKQKSVKTARDYLIILDKLKRKDKGGEQAWWDLVYQLDFAQDDLVKIGRFIKDFNKKAGGDRGGAHPTQTSTSDSMAHPPTQGNVKSKLSSTQGQAEINLSVKLFNELAGMDLSDSGKMASKILIEKVKRLLESVNSPLGELAREVCQMAGRVNEIRTKEDKEAMLNLNKFYEIAKTHEEFYDADLGNFLYYLDVLEDLGIEIEAAELEEEGVRLMTSHATKGLEFKTVIITNVAQSRFPMERFIPNGLIPTELLPEVKEDIKGLSEDEAEDFVLSYEKHHQMLEERRLAYVSFTRAKEKLVLTFADKYGHKKFFPSRFLNEIEYRLNDDIKFEMDKEEKYVEPQIDIKTGLEFGQALGSGRFEELLSEIVSSNGEEKEKKHTRFSPSALLLFDECEKQFEYKYVYNMPERKTASWEAMRLGSFVHVVLERGVSSGFSSVENFLDLTRQLSMEEEWESVELEDAELLVKVFFERNNNKFSAESKTEQVLPLKLADMNFIGFADRIDFTNHGAEIVDYKTGKSAVRPKNRNWQLGFYALAAKEKYGSVRKVTLDMLKQDKPLEFEIDEKGNATCLSSDRMGGFNIYEVESELIQAAHRIQEAYKKGFRACPVEKNCEFCNEYVHGL